MGALVLTQAIIYAAGADMANRLMRQAGRSYWTAEDYDAAVSEMHRLIACVSPERLREWGWA